MHHTTFRLLVTADTPEGMGLCCEHGYLSLLDIRMKAKPEGRLTPMVLEREIGFEYSSCSKILTRWRQGKIPCQKHKSCVLVRTGIKPEDIPQLSAEHLKFLQLRSKPYMVWRARTEVEPIGPVPVHGRVVALSRGSDWLYVGIAMDYVNKNIHLGDQLILDDTPTKDGKITESTLWGTVIDIDGNNVYIMFPGKNHGIRNKRIRTGENQFSPARAGWIKEEED